MSGNVKLVNHLIELGSPIDPKDETEVTPFILAASAGKTDVCQVLIDNGANVDSQTTQGHSALQYSCSKGWLEVRTTPTPHYEIYCINLLLDCSDDIR